MTPIITYLIIGVTCVVSYLAFNDSALRARLLFVPAQVKDRDESYRFLTHGLIHPYLINLLFNLFSPFSYTHLTPPTLFISSSPLPS